MLGFTSMNLLVEFAGRVLISLLCWLVLFPIMLLLATPIVLIAALFAPDPYWQAVRGFYGCVTYIWIRWIPEIL